MKPSAGRLEYQQLEDISLPEIKTRYSQPTFWLRLEKIWQFLKKHLTEPPQLRVWHTCDQEGNIWWSAYDPKTRRSICRISEEQMRVWIEQRYR